MNTLFLLLAEQKNLMCRLSNRRHKFFFWDMYFFIYAGNLFIFSSATVSLGLDFFPTPLGLAYAVGCGSEYSKTRLAVKSN